MGFFFYFFFNFFSKKGRNLSGELGLGNISSGNLPTQNQFFNSFKIKCFSIGAGHVFFFFFF